jgi:hypothetical protein
VQARAALQHIVQESCIAIEQVKLGRCDLEGKIAELQTALANANAELIALRGSRSKAGGPAVQSVDPRPPLGSPQQQQQQQ